MKKSILTLFILLVCAIQTATAYEYFTIYFSNGTKSEAFYATDVDSICYSKLSLDSIIYDDWQVQEIYTCDSIYRYPLAQIDSLSFKDVDENKVAEDIDRANNLIVPIYAQCESIEELSKSLSVIRDIEGVEDAWVNEQSLFVDIHDYGTISFIYPPALTSLDSQYDKYKLPANNAARQNINEHNHIEVSNACIYNQTIKDENSFFDAADDAYDIIYGMNQTMGISCRPFTDLTPSFFQKDIFNYDLIFLLTHGEYDSKHNLHWLYTSEELLCAEKENWQSNIAAATRLLAKYPSYSPYLIGCAAHKEIRNGKLCVVYYTKISEKFISASPYRFKKQGNAIVFNVACQSLKGNNNLAKAFIDKGAGCYLGYNETNNIGHGGAQEFCAGLLNGSSVQGAFKCIPSKWKEQMYETNNACYPVELRVIKSNDKIANTCIIDIETLDSNGESTNHIIRGRIKMLNTSIVDYYSFGFQLSTTSDMSQAKDIKAVDNYDSNSLYRNWEKALEDSDLQPNTTYYYRAYMNDGYSNCYGEIKQFTTKGNAEAYAILVDSTATLYYDNKMSERTGKKIFFPLRDNNKVTKVVFDPSFADYTPTSTEGWFAYCNKLKVIENLKFLNTANVTTMSSMFLDCRFLTSLDLSNFNTANVTDMSDMFAECRSLTSLDLSNFNTANVTNMGGMFAGISLTSLNLSSFNTTNVTNMRAMFIGCNSLTSLNLSSFNTANVTTMEYMFHGCSSLTSLDLSSFNTANVTTMEYMFHGCSSLTSLDLSSFNTANVTDITGMFYKCSSLTSLDMSNFNLTYHVDHQWDSPLFSGCNSLTNLNCRNLVLADITGVRLFEGLKNLKHIDLSNSNTSEATSMLYLFYECSSLTSLDLSSFNTANVTDMRGMFYKCSSLTSLNLSSFNTANVTTMGSMFYECSSLTSLNLSSFNTANVTNMEGMFGECSSLTSLDLSSFNTANVTDMGGMFYECSSLISLNLSNFNTANVTDMGSMFRGCSSLKKLNLSSFNTANVTDMEWMFYECSSLTSLDLSSFNTANVTDMSFMFQYCSSLRTIYAGNWKSRGTILVFFDCNNLVGGKGTKIGDNLYGYDNGGYPLYYYCSNSDAAAHIDGGKDNPGLFTAK